MSLPRYERYKKSGVEWLGEVPEHWQIKRIGYYFNERREKVSDKDYPALSVTKNGIVPQLDTAAKSDDGDNRKKVCKGDFVINSRSDRKGSSGSSDLEGSVSLICTVIRPQEHVYTQFVHHLLRCQPFQEEFYRNGKGIVADLWSTNYSEMRNILLGMPPLPEQQAITAFLDRETAKIDALIAEQQRLIGLLAEKRQATISHAVTKGLNPDAPMKDSGVEWLGEMPAHWEARTIAKSSTKITNGYVGPTRDILVDRGTPYIQATHIKGGRINFDDGYFVTPEWSSAHAKSILAEEDVLLVQTGAGTGDVGLVSKNEVGFNCHALIIVAPDKSLLRGTFLSALLQSTYGQEKLTSIETGAMHPHLNCGEVKFVEIPLPPLDEQADIVASIREMANQFDTLTAEAQRAITLLQERRTALISAAVTGKINVQGVA